MSSRTLARRRTHTFAALAAVATALTLPGAASASIGAVNGTSLSFAASPGELNVVQVTPVTNTLRIQDSAGIVRGPRCNRISDLEVSCPSARLTAVRATAADGDDEVTSGVNLPSAIAGESGNDTLMGAAADDDLQGGDGADLLDGRAGNDTLDGGSGADALAGGDGADTIHARDVRSTTSTAASGPTAPSSTPATS